MATYVTVRQLSQKQPAFTMVSMRHLIFDADKNGLNKAGVIKRIGKKVVINYEAFLSWVDGGAV